MISLHISQHAFDLDGSYPIVQQEWQFLFLHIISEPKTPLLFPLVKNFSLYRAVNHLSVDESLDVVQPPSVLTLLLDVDVVGNKDGESLGDATLLEEALHEDLEVVIEAAEGRSRVDVGTLLGGLGGLDLGNLGVVVVEEVLDYNVAVLGGGINVESARGLAGLLDNNGQVDGGGVLLLSFLIELLLELLVGTGVALAALGLTLEAFLLETVLLGVGVVASDIGDREADSDPGIGVSHRPIKINCDCRNSLLVAKVSDQLDNLLAGGVNKLESTVVKEILDAGRVLLIGLHVLLDLDLALKLGQKLAIVLGGLSEDCCGESGLGRS